MADAILAANVALDNKGLELWHKGHYARASEKHREAVVVAEALGYEDCLITALLQLHEAASLFANAQAANVAPEAGRAGLSRAVELVIAAMSVLDRRKAAGTLLEGKCRPVEVAWNLSRLQHRAVLYGFTCKQDFNKEASFIGYEAYVLAASEVLDCAWGLSGQNKDEILGTQLDFLADAIDLMAQRRDDLPLSAEPSLVSMMPHFEETGALKAYPARQRVLDAWARLQSSGALQQRHLTADELGKSSSEAKAVAAKRKAALAAEVRRACALQSCGAREVHAAQFKKCGACKTVVYCCRVHQVADWSGHKAACKAARKAAESADSAGTSGGA